MRIGFTNSQTEKRMNKFIKKLLLSLRPNKNDLLVKVTR